MSLWSPSQYKDCLSQVMITRLIWTIWTPMASVPKKADKLNLSLPGMRIPTLMIRRSQDSLIFNMGIPILVRQHLYIETAPWWPLLRLLLWCPTLNVRLLQLFLIKSCTHRFHLEVRNLEQSCRDLTVWSGTEMIVPAMVARQHALCVHGSSHGTVAVLLPGFVIDW